MNKSRMSGRLETWLSRSFDRPAAQTALFVKPTDEELRARQADAEQLLRSLDR